MKTLNRSEPARNPEYRCNSRRQFGVHRWNVCELKGGNDAITSLDRRSPAGVEPFGANRQRGSAGRCRGCRAEVGHGLRREQSRYHAALLCQRRRAVWGTLSPTIRSDPAALKAYFVGAFQALPKATVKFGDQLIRVYGNTAVNSGYYTFSYTKDGETKSIPARYSLTYVKDGNDWKIVDHHSSAVPAPPK